MKRNFPTEFLYQVFALIIAVIVVHAVYVTVVRPRATEVMAEQTLRIQEEENYTAERSVWVLIRDFEQESCFVLMFWAFSIMGFKATTSLSERSLLQRELVPVPDGVRILPEDSREYARTIQALPDRLRDMLLPRVLLSAQWRILNYSEDNPLIARISDLYSKPLAPSPTIETTVRAMSELMARLNREIAVAVIAVSR